MSRRICLLSLAAVVTLGAALVTPLSAQAGGRPFTTTLSGANEVGGGDPDGSGTARVWVNPGTDVVCYEITVMNVDGAVAAHIHHAPAGVNGPVVVPFAAPTAGTSSGCVDVARELARDIVKHPADYYVNVHTAVVPAGAVRGQLG
jgi:hypothetical protein